VVFKKAVFLGSDGGSFSRIVTPPPPLSHLTIGWNAGVCFPGWFYIYISPTPFVVGEYEPPPLLHIILCTCKITDLGPPGFMSFQCDSFRTFFPPPHGLSSPFLSLDRGQVSTLPYSYPFVSSFFVLKPLAFSWGDRSKGGKPLPDPPSVMPWKPVPRCFFNRNTPPPPFLPFNVRLQPNWYLFPWFGGLVHSVKLHKSVPRSKASSSQVSCTSRNSPFLTRRWSFFVDQCLFLWPLPHWVSSFLSSPWKVFTPNHLVSFLGKWQLFFFH